MSKLKAALVGVGNIAQTVHLPGYMQNSDVEIAAACDVNAKAASGFAELHGIPAAYTSHKEMLEAECPDLVSVCVPNVFHHEIVMDALQSGSNVLCEKPPAISYAQCLQMAECADGAGKVLAYNFGHRFRPEVQRIKAMVAGGELGGVYSGNVQATRRRAVPGWGVFTNRAMQGGGALIDLGIHMLDAALYALGFPKPAYAAAGSYDSIGRQGGEGMFGSWEGGDAFTVEDALFGFIGFDNGLTLSISTSFALHNGQRETTLMNMDLYGDRAGVSLSPFIMHTCNGQELADIILPAGIPASPTAAVDDFITAVMDGHEPLANGENTLLTQQLVESLYRAAESGQPVLI